MMEQAGLFQILLLMALVVGFWLVVRILRFPKSFFDNQKKFKDVQKKLNHQKPKAEEDA